MTRDGLPAGGVAAERWGLAALVMAGLALRIYADGFGMPNPYVRLDEVSVVDMAMRMASGRLDPGYIYYPAFMPECLAVVYLFFYGAVRLAGWVSGPEEFAAAYLADPTVWFILARAVSGLAGALSIILVFRLAGRLGNRPAAWIAAALAAAQPLLVREAHHAKIDTVALFWVLLTLDRLAAAVQTGRYGGLLMAGALAGLAAATHYVMGVLWMVVAATGALAWPERLPVRRWLAPLGLGVVAFLAVNPFLVPHIVKGSDAVSQWFGHFGGGGTGWRPALGYHLGVTIPGSVGWGLVVAGFSGLGLACRAGVRAPAAPVLLFFLLHGGMVTLFWSKAMARYVLPEVMLLCLGAGWAAGRLSRCGKAWRWAAWGLAAALLSGQVRHSIRLVELLSLTDTSVLARDWVERNLPEGSGIALTSGLAPSLTLTPDGLRSLRDLKARAGGGRLATALLRHPDRVTRPRFRVVAVGPPHPDVPSVPRLSPAVVRGLKIGYAVDVTHPFIPGYVPAVPGRRGRLVAFFSPWRRLGRPPRFDFADAYGLPLDRPPGVERPGMFIWIYRLS